MPVTMSAPSARVSTTAKVRSGVASERKACTMRASASSSVEGMNQNSGWLSRQPRRFSIGATKMRKVRETLLCDPSNSNCLARADAVSARILLSSVGES